MIVKREPKRKPRAKKLTIGKDTSFADFEGNKLFVGDNIFFQNPGKETDLSGKRVYYHRGVVTGSSKTALKYSWTDSFGRARNGSTMFMEKIIRI